MEHKSQHQLAAEMDIALMKAYLRLDLDQVLNPEIQQSFQRVNSLPNLLIRGSTYFSYQASGFTYSSTHVPAANDLSYSRSMDACIIGTRKGLDSYTDIHHQSNFAKYYREAIL